MQKLLFFSLSLLFFGCQQQPKEASNNDRKKKVNPIVLSREEAMRLVQLPLDCINTEYPNKLNQVISSEEDLLPPKELHPAFYGCFDWHSAVHGHWSLVRLLKSFPDLEEKSAIIKGLKNHFSKENIEGEIAYFELETSQGFERMYGWAWLLKLSEELHTWNTPEARELEENLKPLSELIANRVEEFLPKLNNAIRVGTHTNTAFALTLIYDYAESVDDIELLAMVKDRARFYYEKDVSCLLSWEPSGYDFLSPCLEEADLMRRVLSQADFKRWFNKFLPQLADPNYILEPGVVSDRKDGHLVHLDGLNYSRAWCLSGIAESLPEYNHLIELGNDHIKYSLSSLTDGNYEGGHWLASFALMSLAY
ncbi:MAG: DUF2891 domain-containing protein [Crocinitomicaceae bacterium]